VDAIAQNKDGRALLNIKLVKLCYVRYYNCSIDLQNVKSRDAIDDAQFAITGAKVVGVPGRFTRPTQARRSREGRVDVDGRVGRESRYKGTVEDHLEWSAASTLGCPPTVDTGLHAPDPPKHAWSECVLDGWTA